KPLVGLLPGGNLLRATGQFALRRYNPELLLAGESLFAHLIPTLVELALVLGDPVLRNVVRRMASARSEVDEEWLVGRHRPLVPDPEDGLVSEVFHQVVTFLRRAPRLDRSGPLV